jgi:hypothetical protein
MPSNQHAAILRHMAGDEQCAAQYSRFLATRGTHGEAVKHEADAEGFLVKSAALLAGAEALEAVEAAKAEAEGLREKAEMLDWYLRSSERCAWLCGMLGQPFSWLEEPKPQALSALRAARGAK